MRKYKIRAVIIYTICITISATVISGCSSYQGNGKARTTVSNETYYYTPKEYENGEFTFFAETLGLADTEDLDVSIKSLHEHGCGETRSINLGEYYQWDLLHFTVIDAEGNAFYASTNQHGGFGPILSQTGKDNADIIAKTLRLSPTGRILYTAGMLEK